MNGTGSSSRNSVFNRDGRSGPQIRDGVIPQHDRSVKSGGQFTQPKHAGLGLDLSRSLQEMRPQTRSPDPEAPTLSSSRTRIRSGFSLQNRRACGLQHNMADGP